MAKFIPGPLTGEIRNKLGAQVFSRNQSGAYTRAHVFPNQEITTRRATVRARWAAANASWSDDLSDAQRYAWNALAFTLGSRPGPVNGRKLSGRTLFVSCYCNLDNIGVVPIIDAPDQPIAGQLTSLSVVCDADAETLIIDADEGANPPDQGLVVFASPPLSLARYTARDLWKQIAAITPNPALPTDLWTEYADVHGLPDPDRVIIIGVSPVAALTGLAGPRLVARCTVTGTGGIMFQKITTLTNAQIKALPSTAVTLVSAVVGKLIVPLMMSLQLNAAAGAYTNITSAASSRIRTAGPLGRSFSIRNDGLLSAAEKRTSFLPPLGALDALPPTNAELQSNVDQDEDIEGTALTLTCVNAAGDFTGGNAANTLTATIWYMLLDAI